MSTALMFVTGLYLVTLMVLLAASVRWTDLAVDEDSVIRGALVATPFMVVATVAENNLLVVSEWLDRITRFTLFF